ncbi:PRC-barrel domain-containing protein [Candidatus Micrarchaeota archaeon]|nr:PRC-barrel domain-containing protein [Candidatus Micrarchaeota archaeon]
MNRLSEIYGKKIYTQDSKFLGVSSDVLIDPHEGTIKYLLKGDAAAILSKPEQEQRKYIRDNFIPFSKVKAVGEIIIIG